MSNFRFDNNDDILIWIAIIALVIFLFCGD